MQIRQVTLKDGSDYLDRLAERFSTDDFTLQMELALAYVKLGSLEGKPNTTSLGDTVGAIESYEKAIRLLENVYKNTKGESLGKWPQVQLLKTYRQIGTAFSRANQEKEKGKSILNDGRRFFRKFKANFRTIRF